MYLGNDFNSRTIDVLDFIIFVYFLCLLYKPFTLP